jgi:mannose-6-phosphate isomerase-like protein (cupin superfamily)
MAAESTTAVQKRAYTFLGNLVVVHVGGDETDGRFCVLEFVQPSGEWTPLHLHRGADQTEFVLEGELTVYRAGGSVVVGPGRSIHNPMNEPHTQCVTSTGPARVLDVVAPAGFDEFVAAAGAPVTELSLPAASEAPPDLERLSVLGARYGIELLGPPGALP